MLGGRTYIVTGENDFYRNLKKIEFIVTAKVVVYRKLNIVKNNKN
jgi:hypothetical protein